MQRKKEQEELLGSKLTLEARVETLTAEVTQLNSEYAIMLRGNVIRRVESMHDELENLRSTCTEQEEQLEEYVCVL